MRSDLPEILKRDLQLCLRSFVLVSSMFGNPCDKVSLAQEASKSLYTGGP